MGRREIVLVGCRVSSPSPITQQPSNIVVQESLIIIINNTSLSNRSTCVSCEQHGRLQKDGVTQYHTTNHYVRGRGQPVEVSVTGDWLPVRLTSPINLLVCYSSALEREETDAWAHGTTTVHTTYPIHLRFLGPPSAQVKHHSADDDNPLLHRRERCA
jgi:hypothetical protein